MRPIGSQTLRIYPTYSLSGTTPGALKEEYDTVVIGSGIMGTTTAYEVRFLVSFLFSLWHYALCEISTTFDMYKPPATEFPLHEHL